MSEKVRPIPKPRRGRHYIRAWRKYRMLTQEQLAERIDVTAGFISQLENGIVNYTQDRLEAIAVALDCTSGDLLSRDPFIDDAVADLNKILSEASAPDRARALRVLREMLSTGTEK